MLQSYYLKLWRKVEDESDSRIFFCCIIRLQSNLNTFPFGTIETNCVMIDSMLGVFTSLKWILNIHSIHFNIINLFFLCFRKNSFMSNFIWELKFYGFSDRNSPWNYEEKKGILPKHLRTNRFPSVKTSITVYFIEFIVNEYLYACTCELPDDESKVIYSFDSFN